MKKNIKLTLSFILIVIFVIILLILYIILVDIVLDYIILIYTKLDNILYNTNTNNYNYNMIYRENYILDNKNQKNTNTFYSKIDKVIEYTRTVTIDMFGYIKNQKKYNPNNFITVLDIVSQQKNFNIAGYNIRESVVNQKNFKIGLSNLERIFENCNEHETEVFSFIYKNQNEFQNLYKILETLKKDENSIFARSMNFISNSKAHYFMNIQGQKFIFTDSLSNINIIKNIYGNNYVTYPYASLYGVPGTQIVIPEIKDNEYILNTKYEYYKEIVDNKEQNKIDQINNIYEYTEKNKNKINYIIENNIDNENLTLKNIKKLIALKAIEDNK